MADEPIWSDKDIEDWAHRRHFAHFIRGDDDELVGYLTVIRATDAIEEMRKMRDEYEAELKKARAQWPQGDEAVEALARAHYNTFHALASSQTWEQVSKKSRAHALEPKRGKQCEH